MFKIGDIVECAEDNPYQQYFYRYSEIKSLDEIGYVGVPYEADLSYSLTVRTGEEPNWRASLFKKIEHPETLPCYKYILLHGHSPE